MCALTWKDISYQNEAQMKRSLCSPAGSRRAEPVRQRPQRRCEPSYDIKSTGRSECCGRCFACRGLPPRSVVFAGAGANALGGDALHRPDRRHAHQNGQHVRRGLGKVDAVHAEQPGQHQDERHIEQPLADHGQKQPVPRLADGLERDGHHIAQPKRRVQRDLRGQQPAAIVYDQRVIVEQQHADAAGKPDDRGNGAAGGTTP